MKTINDLLSQIEALAQQARHGDDQEVLTLHTNLRLELRGADGELKDTRDVHNDITFTGKNLILLASGGKLPAAFSYVGLGTGSTANTLSGGEASNTALVTESATRVNGIVTNPSAGSSSTAATLQISATFAAGVNTGSITESGLFDASTAGNMLARQVFGVITKSATDSLQILWQLS